MVRTLEKLPLRARSLPTSLIMYSSPLCQMKTLAEARGTFFGVNLKSEVREAVGCRCPQASVLKVTTGSRNVEPDECNREDNALREDRDPVLHTPVLLLLFN